MTHLVRDTRNAEISLQFEGEWGDAGCVDAPLNLMNYHRILFY